MKRALLIALGVLLVLAAAAGGTTLYLLNSRDGLTRTLLWGAALLPGTLTVEEVQGRLRGPLSLRGLSYHDAEREVRLEELALEWQPGDLLDHLLHIKSLTLRGLQVVQHNTQPHPYEGIPNPPFTLIVEHLEASDLSVQSGDAAPRRIDRIALAGRFDAGVYTIDSLAAQAAWGELNASGSLQTRGRDRLELDTAWRLALPGRPALRGGGRIEGDSRRLTTTQTLQAPLPLTLEVSVDDPYSAAPDWSLRTASDELDLRPWQPALTAPLRDVALTLQGNGTSFRGEARLAYPLAQAGSVRIATRLSGSPSAVTLSGLELAPEGSDARLRLDASLDLATDPPAARITGGWEQLQWPLQGTARIASPKGSFRIEGTPDAYRVDLEAPLQRPDASLGTWRAAGNGNRDGVTLTTVTAQVADGKATGSGALQWRNGINWQAQLQLADIDPGSYLAAWPGRLGATVSARGDTTPVTRIAIADLHGELRGHTIDAATQLTATAHGVRVEQGELRSGSAHLKLSGDIGESLDLAFDLDAPALQELLTDASGQARARGRLRGSAAAPRLDATVQLSDLAWGTARLQQAQGEISADLAAAGAVKATIDAKQLHYGARALEQAHLSADGSAQAHTLRLAARGAGGELTLALHGGYAAAHWQGELREGRWVQPAAGTWSLVQPATLSLGRDRVTLARHCWRQTSAESATPPGALCLRAQWAQSGEWGIDGNAEHLPLALLDPLLPGGAQVSGPLDGSFQLQRDANGRQSGSAQLRLGPGSLHPGQAAAEARVVTHRGGELNLHLEDERLAGELALQLEQEGTLAGQITLRPFALAHPGAPDTAIGGDLRLKLPDLGLIAALLPRLGIGPGTLQAHLALGGTLAAPRLQGEATLEAQQIEVGAAGITLKALSLRATSDDGRRWQVSGSTTSGGGKLAVEGVTELDPARGWPTRLQVRGERFEAVNLRDYWALVSPDLTLQLERGRFSVDGALAVPEAQIRPRRGGSEAQTESRDVVIVGAPTPADTTPLAAFYARIALTLGDKVEFSGYGLRSRITGKLTLEDAPDSVVKGTGELRVVEGKYKSYGQDLTVESGRLTFAGGPVDNPGIDARAVRTSGEVTAGILLRGTLRDPQVTLFSTPSLPQADILSYLVLGVPVSQADQQSGGSSLLASAAALGYVADSPLVRQIRRGLGIEDLRIESDSTRETVAVTLGRYLSPRLYISYSVGLSDNDSVFRIRYKVGRNWTLETESGAQSGTDLRYVIEK